MNLVYRRSALKAMNGMPPQDRDALDRKLLQFAVTGIGDVIKIAGSDEWRLRHGNWRAILTVANEVVVVRVAHRRDVYR